ncbi:MAG: YkgJ family cysteine cluster protein [Planctomycetota bacterium]|nr:YkgJ family cysteine cluster protein [Planctomycetota bacterium]
MASKESLCSRCTAICCRYFALQIDTPTDPAEFDDIRWYLAHESVHVFIEDGDWYLAIQTRCQHLAEDNRCGIYEDRPKICREFSTENCDYHQDAYGFDQYFTGPEQLEAYAQAKLGARYTRYVLRQRRLNVGEPATGSKVKRGAKRGSQGKGFAAAVLASRARTRIMGHPGKRPASKNGGAGKGGGETPLALVPLSISVGNR